MMMTSTDPRLPSGCFCCRIFTTTYVCHIRRSTGWLSWKDLFEYAKFILSAKLWLSNHMRWPARVFFVRNSTELNRQCRVPAGDFGMEGYLHCAKMGDGPLHGHSISKEQTML